MCCANLAWYMITFHTVIMAMSGEIARTKVVALSMITGMLFHTVTLDLVHGYVPGTLNNHDISRYPRASDTSAYWLSYISIREALSTVYENGREGCQIGL